PAVPWLARVTGGRAAVAGLLICTLAVALLAADAVLLSPLLAAVAAALFGVAYGIFLVAGLVGGQAMADPAALAGLTGIYWSLTYLGFCLPVVLAGLAGRLPYDR